MDAHPDSDSKRRSPLLPIVIVVALLGAVSAAVIFVVSGSSANEFDPIEAAELAPSDTHFFMAFNTDFASSPWAAVPKLLNTLGIEQSVRDDLEESAAEENLDYENEIVPTLGTIRRAGFAGQYTPDGGEWLIFIDSRDPERVVDLVVGNDNIESDARDEALGLDFKIYTDMDSRSATPMVIATHQDIVYFAETTEAISNFIRRRENSEPLSSSARFQDAIAEVQDDALSVGYLSGNALDQRDFRDIVDAFRDTTDLDPRDGTIAFAVTARDIGFGARLLISLESGFGSLAPALASATDLSGITAMVPDDALFLFAGSGLHDSLVEALDDSQTQPLVDEMLAPFEEMTGLNLKEDLLPLFGSSYALAAGGDGLASDSTDLSDAWGLGLIESSDPARLAERLNLLQNELEFFICDCETGVVITDQPGYVAIQWPDIALSDATIDESPAFIKTLESLPPSPTNLLFINVSRLPEQRLRDTSAGWGADSGSYELDLTTVPGFAFATYADDTSLSIDVVLPIAANED
jgi:uncharacterized protein DUF3352